MHIPQTFSHRRRIHGGDSTKSEENPCVIIRQFSEKKPVMHNQEINTPPQNFQVRHIGCICVFPDAPLEQPKPRLLRSNILTLIDTTRGIQNFGPNKNIKSYTRKATHSHQQAGKHTSEHSHRPTYHRRIYFSMRSY